MSIEILDERPYADGVTAGRSFTSQALNKAIAAMRKHRLLRGSVGSMSRAELGRFVVARLEAVPDYARYPELEDLYPERVDTLRGFAEGAGCSLETAAVHDYLCYRIEIDGWYDSLNNLHDQRPTRGAPGCSGILLVGPDGVVGGQSVESGPPPKPRGYRFKKTAATGKWMKPRPQPAKTLVLRKPRTGYIQNWGLTNEKGVAQVSGASCGTLLDEPIEDTWPIGPVPLLRFARDADHLAELYQRYTLHNWGRANQIWADTKGRAVMVEKSFRRIGIRRIGDDQVLWCTEGHRDTPQMADFMRRKRLAHIEKAGKHLGAGDLQYATDCAVRFTHLAELCHEAGKRDLKHLNRILTDHATFPRAICRHGGPDTDPYDTSVTMDSRMSDLTHNRQYERPWDPWKTFPCERPWQVTQYPAVPG